MVDPNPCRMLSFTEGIRRSWHMLNFLLQRLFLDELRRLKPDKYLGI